MVYVRSIKPKERVYNKSGWILKIDIEKSSDFLFFAKNHRLFGIFSRKPYLGERDSGPAPRFDDEPDVDF